MPNVSMQPLLIAPQPLTQPTHSFPNDSDACNPWTSHSEKVLELVKPQVLSCSRLDSRGWGGALYPSTRKVDRDPSGARSLWTLQMTEHEVSTQESPYMMRVGLISASGKVSAIL